MSASRGWRRTFAGGEPRPVLPTVVEDRDLVRTAESYVLVPVAHRKQRSNANAFVTPSRPVEAAQPIIMPRVGETVGKGTGSCARRQDRLELVPPGPLGFRQGRGRGRGRGRVQTVGVSLDRTLIWYQRHLCQALRSSSGSQLPSAASGHGERRPLHPLPRRSPIQGRSPAWTYVRVNPGRHPSPVRTCRVTSADEVSGKGESVSRAAVATRNAGTAPRFRELGQGCVPVDRTCAGLGTVARYRLRIGARPSTGTSTRRQTRARPCRMVTRPSAARTLRTQCSSPSIGPGTRRPASRPCPAGTGHRPVRVRRPRVSPSVGGAGQHRTRPPHPGEPAGRRITAARVHRTNGVLG